MSGSPQSIAAAIDLLNALPSPVDVACFVESLDRPLEVLATGSQFSAQPSADLHNPRIFIRKGRLTMAIVPKGMGVKLLEFSEEAGQGRAIKGEVELPREGKLSGSAAFDRVRVGEGTTCGVCHDDESPTSASGIVFASETLRPLPEFDVSLDVLRQESEACDPSAGETEHTRCDILSALLDHGEVQPGVLPPGRLCHH